MSNGGDTMANDPVEGKRVFLNEEGHLILGVGDYGKDADGVWWARVPAPGFSMATLTLHEIIEHDDHTITASPSILMEKGNGVSWHGYLVKGVWRQV